jgi:hypothetical protein
MLKQASCAGGRDMNALGQHPQATAAASTCIGKAWSMILHIAITCHGVAQACPEQQYPPQLNPKRIMDQIS